MSTDLVYDVFRHRFDDQVGERARPVDDFCAFVLYRGLTMSMQGFRRIVMDCADVARILCDHVLQGVVRSTLVSEGE